MAMFLPNCRTERSVLGYLLAFAIVTVAVVGQGAMASQLDNPPVPASNGTASESAEAKNDDTATSPQTPQLTPADEPPTPMAEDGPSRPASAAPPTPANGASTDSTEKEKEAEEQGDESSHKQDSRDHADSSQTRGFFAKLLRWLGKFHPVTVHFPIALLLVAGLAEVLWAVSDKPNFRFTARYCLLLGGLGAVGSATLGWFLAGFQLTDPTWIRTTHRWLGTSTAVWAVLTLVLSEMNERRNSINLERSYWATLFLGAALVGVTGFFGGAMIYGLDHYRWPTPTNQTEMQSTAATEAEATAVVEMNDEFEFDPEKVSITAGETVLWKGVGNYAHTVTADPDKADNPDNVRLPEGASTFDSGRIQPGETFSYTFEVPGSYRYFCIPHELAGMVGEVEVKPERRAARAGRARSHLPGRQ